MEGDVYKTAQEIAYGVLRKLAADDLEAAPADAKKTPPPIAYPAGKREYPPAVAEPLKPASDPLSTGSLSDSAAGAPEGFAQFKRDLESKGIHEQPWDKGLQNPPTKMTAEEIANDAVATQKVEDTNRMQHTPGYEDALNRARARQSFQFMQRSNPNDVTGTGGQVDAGQARVFNTAQNAIANYNAGEMADAVSKIPQSPPKIDPSYQVPEQAMFDRTRETPGMFFSRPPAEASEPYSEGDGLLNTRNPALGGAAIKSTPGGLLTNDMVDAPEQRFWGSNSGQGELGLPRLPGVAFNEAAPPPSKKKKKRTFMYPYRDL